MYKWKLVEERSVHNHRGPASLRTFVSDDSARVARSLAQAPPRSPGRALKAVVEHDLVRIVVVTRVRVQDAHSALSAVRAGRAHNKVADAVLINVARGGVIDERSESSPPFASIAVKLPSATLIDNIVLR